MDEWDNKNNGTGPDAEQTDSANDTHIETTRIKCHPIRSKPLTRAPSGRAVTISRAALLKTSKGSSPINRPTNITKRRQAVGGRMAAAHKKEEENRADCADCNPLRRACSRRHRHRYRLDAGRRRRLRQQSRQSRRSNPCHRRNARQPIHHQ